MKSLSERIIACAWAALRGETGEPEEFTTPGYCLAAVRNVLDHALGLPRMGFYAEYLEGKPKALPPHEGWWARDLEHILRCEGWAVSPHQRQPGDLLCKYDVAEPYGHVAILLDHDMVFENVAREFRPHSFYAPGLTICLTPLSDFPAITTTIRIHERKVAK